MIDLNKLNKKIDELFEKETSDSLTKWLLNKRFGNISLLLGDGKFVSMKSQNTPLFITKKKAKFNKKDSNAPVMPINRFAA